MKNISKIKFLLIAFTVLLCFCPEHCFAETDFLAKLKKDGFTVKNSNKSPANNSYYNQDTYNKALAELNEQKGLTKEEKESLAKAFASSQLVRTDTDLKLAVFTAANTYLGIKKQNKKPDVTTVVNGSLGNANLKGTAMQPSDHSAAQLRQSHAVVVSQRVKNGDYNYKKVDKNASKEEQNKAIEHNKQVDATIQADKDHFTDETTKNKEAVAKLDNEIREAYEDVVRSNAGYCNIEALKTDYMANCYSCVIVSTLIRTFMNISNITYPLTQEAGVKLLVIGMCLWLAFFVLRKVSSFVSLEPMKILQELFTFFFKCLLAYTLVTSGLRMITDLLVDPILKAGADYGIGIIDSVMSDWSTTDDSTKSSDEYYQMENVKDQQDAAKVEQKNNVKVVGQIDANKIRPENLSQIKESKRNYCQTGSGDAFGAYQLDYSWQAFEFSQQCSDPRFRNALNKAGIKQSCRGQAACANKVKSALLPVVEQICSEAGGRDKMKEMQEKYHRENNFVPAFSLINQHCKLNPKLTLSNYNQPQYFTLSAALISGYNHNPEQAKKSVGKINCSGNTNDMGNQLYDALDNWWVNNPKNPKKNHRYRDEKKMCQDVLSGKNIDTSTFASSGSGGSSSPTYSSVQHNYYVVKDKNDSYGLIPIASDGKTVVDRTVFDKIMKISRKADQAVSLNFVIGDAIICHSMHAGAYQFSKKITDLIGINFYFPDIWLWACGALIWFFALMVVIGVNFYLLDLSFKVGFALLALPITIGLWPFNKFKDAFVKCIKIIANAAGTFMFLGISTGLSVILISTALGGTDALFDAINNDDKRYISEKFSLTGGSFLLILFAFLYSHKLISETVSRMANAFFSAVTNGLDPMHKKTTQAIDFAKKQVTNAVSEVGGAAGKAVNKNVINPLKNGAQNMTKKAARGVVKGVGKLMGGGKK